MTAYPALWAVPVALLGGVALLLLPAGRPARVLTLVVAVFCLICLATAAIGAPPGPDRAGLAVALAALLVALDPASLDRSGPALLRLGMVLLGVLADNIFLTWIGALGAMTVIDGQRPVLAPERALPLLLGLAGTMLLALAARPALGSGIGVTWSALATAAPHCNGAMLGLAFCFLLVGYGAVAGLVPLHRGTEPAPTVASVGLFALLRLRAVLVAHPGALDPGPPLLALGILSVLVAAVGVWRRGEEAEFFTWIGIGQAGIAAAALGFGLPFAALLQIILRMLSVSAARLAGCGKARLAALASCAAIPPFGPFGAVFLVVAGGLARLPIAVLPLGIGIAGMAGGILTRPRPAPVATDGAVRLPVWFYLAVALLLGLVLPGLFAYWVGMAV